VSAADIVLLVGVGALSGAMNAVVGGGTFFTFPLLLALGVPPVAANATTTVALWPASLVASRAYLAELRGARERLPWRSAVAILGGAAGALLLLASGDALFGKMVPWLIGGATLLFAFSRNIVRRLAAFGSRANAASTMILAVTAAVYGGYFGAGVGILLMAALAMAGEADAQVANAQRNLLGALINGTAVAIFILYRAVEWPFALTAMAGAAAGGYLGARAARRRRCPSIRRSSRSSRAISSPTTI